MQPLLLLKFLDGAAVATYAVVLATQQAIFSAAVTGGGWSIYRLRDRPAGLRRLIAKNVFGGVPGAVVGALLLRLLPVGAGLSQRPSTLLIIGMTVLSMKAEEIAHSILDRFFSVISAEAVGIAGLIASTLYIFAARGSQNVLTLVVTAVVTQSLVSGCTALLLLRRATRQASTHARSSSVISTGEDGPTSRSSLILDQLSGNLLAQLELLVLVQHVSLTAFGAIYAVTRPVGLISGTAANLRLRAVAQWSRGRNVEVRDRLHRAGTLSGAIVGCVLAAQSTATLAAGAALTISTAARPWFLRTSLGAASPGQRTAVMKVAAARMITTSAGLIVSVLFDSAVGVIAAATAIGGGELLMALSRKKAPTWADPRVALQYDPVTRETM